MVNITIAFLSMLFGFSQSLQPAPLGLKFSVIGDTQSRYAVYRRAIPKFNSNGAKFLVHLGDQSTWGGNRWYRKFKRRSRNLKIPMHLVIGNHELATYPVYKLKLWRKKVWRKFWGYKKTYYYFDKTHDKYTYRFIILDTSTSLIPRGQAQWLKNILQSLPANGYAIIFAHRPIPVYRKFIPRNIENLGCLHRIRNMGRISRCYNTYRAMVPLVYRNRNRALWNTIYKNRDYILGIFHGHYHAFRYYKIAGIQSFCSGGGGGTLESRYDFYHYLNVYLHKNTIKVQIKLL
jgi:predicted phosphodiesterase